MPTRVSFPQMGTGSLVVKCLLEELGMEVVMPPPTSQATLALGGRVTPEFACLPLKVTLGNYLETIPQGVDVVLMAGGIGPCRFGLYGEVQREILRYLGHDVEFIVIEPPEKDFRSLLAKIKRLIGLSSVPRIPRALALSLSKMKALDSIEQRILHAAPILSPENRRHLWSRKPAYLAALDGASDLRGVAGARRQAEQEIDSLPRIQASKHLRVRIVGEWLVVMEPAVNFHLEEKLSLMGVEIERTIFFSAWVRDNLLYNALGLDWQREIREAAAPYLTRFVGGHGLETVGYTVKSAREGFDGVVQLAPLGCMPEVIAMGILQKVGTDLDIPVLSLLIDEHTASAGAMTRLEAFVDLMESRKKRRQI